MTGRWTSGPADEVLRQVAPEAAESLARLVAAVPESLAGEIALVRAVCAETLSLSPLPLAVAGDEQDRPGPDSALAEVVEQFSIDVTGIDQAQREVLTDTYGARTRDLLAAVYIADWVPRIRRALDLLCAPAGPGWDRSAAEGPAGEPWP